MMSALEALLGAHLAGKAVGNHTRVMGSQGIDVAFVISERVSLVQSGVEAAMANAGHSHWHWHQMW
jgi:hypothetical protein